MASKNFNGCEGERHKKAMVGQSQTVRSQLGKTVIHLYIEKFDLCVTEGKYIKDFRNFSLPLVLKLKHSTSP